MPTINKETTCAFSGHRILPKNFNTKEVEDAVQKLIDSGYNTFLVGMAMGFDMLCFEVVEKLRKTNDIKLYACVPCLNQDNYYSAKDKIRYHKMLDQADEVILLDDNNYYKGCMQKRNMFMVDNSSVLITYLATNHGGTYSTVKYAIEQNRIVQYMGK